MKQENQRQEASSAEVEKTRSLRADKPTLIVVTGIMAAGKSTIARLLAQHFPRGVHIEADVLQRMIVSGGVWVSQPGEPDEEAAQQLRLRLKHLCLLGRSFFEAGFTAVLDDTLIGDRWPQLQELLHDLPFQCPWSFLRLRSRLWSYNETGAGQRLRKVMPGPPILIMYSVQR